MTPHLCPHHDGGACCARCTATTDGRGFPHPREAKGRRRLQRCPGCARWVEPHEWTHDIGKALFGCARCAVLPPEAA